MTRRQARSSVTRWLCGSHQPAALVLLLRRWHHRLWRRASASAVGTSWRHGQCVWSCSTEHGWRRAGHGERAVSRWRHRWIGGNCYINMNIAQTNFLHHPDKCLRFSLIQLTHPTRPRLELYVKLYIKGNRWRFFYLFWSTFFDVLWCSISQKLLNKCPFVE